MAAWGWRGRDEFAESQAPRVEFSRCRWQRSWMPVWGLFPASKSSWERKCFWKLIRSHEATCGQGGSSEDLLLRWLLHSLKNMYKMVFIEA